MYTDVNFNDFRDAFRRFDRLDNFTYEGARALFDYLEQYEEDTGERIELDVIALCCEYNEYENLEEFQRDYGADNYPDMASIEDATHVIPVGSEAFIVGEF